MISDHEPSHLSNSMLLTLKGLNSEDLFCETMTVLLIKIPLKKMA